MPKTATKRKPSQAETKTLAELLGYNDRSNLVLAGYGAGKGMIKDGLESLIAGAEYAGDRKAEKNVPKDVNSLGKMVAQNAGGYADLANMAYRKLKNDGQQAVPDYFRNKAGNAYQEHFNPQKADPRLERFGNFYADPLAVGFGAGRAAKGLTDRKFLSELLKDVSQGTRSNAIDVWHGSPHKFEKFSAMDNIGGGEGAQAYGHGGYHASNKDVAQYYNTTGDAGVLINGKSLAERKKYMELPDDSKAEVYDLLNSVASGKMSKSDLFGMAASSRGSYLTAYNFIRDAKSVKPVDGNLYRNQLRWPDAAREATDPLSDKHFLDWDKPLSEQDASVQGVLTPMLENARSGYPNLSNDPTGDVLYNMIGGNVGGLAQKLSAKTLRDLGIPGIRYLDGGSRSAGAGTHNYVTFDDNLVNILERNGQPVTAPQPGLAGKKKKK